MRGEGLSGEEMVIAAYGAYLLHGGDPENWGKMRQDDIQLIYIMHEAEASKILRLFDTKK